MESGTSVKVAVRIRPLSPEENQDDGTQCVNTVAGMPQIIAGTDAFFTFDNVFGVDSSQTDIYDECVVDLVNAAFEGFNATILAYGQTGSGKTWTMGSASSSDMRMGPDNLGIIPRVITSIFDIMEQKELDDPNSTYKVQVQFLEIYGETIRDLLDHTRTAKVTIRETATGEVFVSGAREEFVSSASQMMKALEDGSKHRTTASTLMNLTSSRSHAIFTVFLEHTIHTAVPTNPSGDHEEDPGESSLACKTDDDSDVAHERTDQKITHSKEVRRCKFHFVDLAGSERAKRTGAQGVQMKEGIDINKGLLALGNVISALGDESRKGKVHVPYRVSKLTRMLQDSLGGNSKTLMICCVSPAGVNFYESLNALRYANRARNIQNKPVVNRDPTLVMIDDLKKLIQTLASELLEVRRRSMSASPDGSFTLTELEAMLANGTMASKRPQIQDGESSPKRPQRRNTAFDMVSAQSIMATTRSFSLPTSTSPQNVPTGANSPKRKESMKEITKLKSRATETDFELKRMTEQMKRVKSEASELSERIVLMQSERDFYHIKYSDLRPDDAISFYKDNRSPLTVDTDGEKGKVTDLIAGYLREIEALKRQVAEKQQKGSSLFSTLHTYDSGALELESELTSNVARVIAQTEKHLLQEAKKLKSKGIAATSSSDGSATRAIAALDDGNESDDDANNASGESSPVCGGAKKNPFAESQIEEDDLAYQRRQKMMTAEVAELGESIDLKEQLLDQLKNSHYQYGVMKTFYEQKLTALNLEMDEKQSERDRLLFELQHLEHNTNKSEAAVRQQQEQEKKLKSQLQKREDELRQMKKRQEELTNLSRVQTRYTAQVAKLECDIESMKRQKVDLSKSLQVEKKRHYTLLNDKAREIDRLKRDLQASTGEAKRLGKDKQKAEERTREALKDTAAMRKKVQEVQKFGLGSSVGSESASRARLARRAMGGAGKNSAARILSEDELRVKKWLDRRIADINAREEAADTLRKQCEQQLALLNKKESLELEKSSLEKSMRDVMTGSHGGERVLSKEEEEAMREIEGRLESVDSQLKLKDRNIFEIESKLGNGDIASAQESTIEALKRNSAVSLPASHELIRLLFDMLVATKSSSQQRKGSLNRSTAREKQLRQELDDAARHMVTLRRTHDMELTRTANEYEEKLAGLFTHSTIGKLVRAESGVEPCEPASMTLSPESTPTASKYKSSADTSYKMLLSVASEQSNLLRSRLEREAARTIELQGRIAEVDHTCSALQRDLDEREVHIKFLEDERALFRDLADSLRAGISTLGGETGHTILRQIKDRVAGAVASDESDDETESMLGEYSNLGDIITRTGNVTEKKRNQSSDKNLSSLSSLSTGSRDVVYDRLTNPSNFTGSMKNAFGDDLAGKREKVKQIKSANISNKKESRANHNKEHIAAYLEGTATPDCSSELNGLPMPPPRGSFLAVAKDSTMNRAKLSGPGTPLARTTTPPSNRLNGTQPNPGPRVKSLAFVKAGLASISLLLTDQEEPRPRSASMTLAEPLKRSPLDLSPTKSPQLTELDVDSPSTVPEMEGEETSPIHITTMAGMVRRPWKEKEKEGEREREGDDETIGSVRRDSVESVYSSVIEEEKSTEEEKLIITIPSRHLSDEHTTAEEYESGEMKRIAALEAARAEEDLSFEDEENYASGGSSVNGTSRSREQTHLLKIKNRLQSATAPMTPITPRSPLPKPPTNIVLKK